MLTGDAIPQIMAQSLTLDLLQFFYLPDSQFREGCAIDGVLNLGHAIMTTAFE